MSNENLLEAFAIRTVVDNWVLWRDAGDWDRFRTVWHDDGYMMATWFQGPKEDFIKVSQEGFARGVSILHFLGGSSIELAGDRASAVAIYRRLGCAYEVRRIERSTAPGEPHAGVLSPRERELARLVALGKNNREAALELSVTVKAVEKYLTSIYQKLGIKSRSQLTAFVGAAEPEQRRSG